MKRMALVGMLIVTVGVRAEDPPKPQAGQKEHEWLAQLAGEWTSEAEMITEPGKPPMKCEGTETARMIGGLWMMSEIKANVFGQQMTGVMTVGYDPVKKKYIGTWVDSMMNHMWHYVGTVDESGKKLTLEADGPNMMDPSKPGKYRDALEIKSKDHKILTSSMLGPDGKWVTFMTVHYKRKK